MRIGIDARELCGKPTGVGRHLAGLLKAWSTDQAASRHTFVLYAHETISTPLRNAELRVIPGSPGTKWEQLALPKATPLDHLDVFFAPGYTAPLLLKTPTVVLVHDISFTAHPEWFHWKEGLRRRLLTRWSSENAQLVLTVSEFARREILEHFGLPEKRVKCIYPGVISLGGSKEQDPPCVRGAARDPTVLFVGSIFNRRHLPDLIQAFKPIARSHAAARLEIVGDNRTHPHEDLPAIADAAGIASQVVIRPYVFDAELAALYGRARAFALLSEYEGFGHPPLEALGSGVPSVLLDTDVAREVCAGAALYVAKGDIAATAVALNSLLFDEEMRQCVLAAAPAVLARYSWASAATETLAALESVR
ncbi:MAG TPA: glycosyltransferase family 1 protein [Vicinamibacterales bacterium]|nr:glycosyltransferase family 1 protein [Vicinamibacterales bacterium]